LKRIIEGREDVEPLLDSFNIESVHGSTDENGRLELGEKYSDQDLTIAILESCSHPEDQVFTRMHPEGKGKCRSCGKIVAVDDQNR